MSGGFFEYKQYHIEEIADSIERVITRQGKEKHEDDLSWGEEFYNKYPEERYYLTYSDVVNEKMKEAVKQLRIASIYVKRIDWFLSGDDAEDSFIERLENDLKLVNR